VSGWSSRFLADRQITIYTPPGYEESGSRYPVLYLHDGQNLFEAERSFAGEIWHVKSTADALIRAGEIEPLIIVGIDHAGPRRIDEYTPTVDLKSKRGGLAKAYGRLLTEELKPWIDSEYRTLADACHTGMGGSSLGALVSLYLGFRAPHVFGRLAILSPSLWWDRKIMLQRLRANIHRRRTRIWLDMGTREGRAYVQNVTQARQLRDALVARGWRLGEDLCYFEDALATHAERAWAHRLPMALKFLFPPPSVLDVCAEDAPQSPARADPIW
jgi:predicted alpha/beta superfamily hydrolase